jgi:hypothetical protein
MTRDVDAMFVPHGVVLEESWSKPPPSWLALA